MAKESYPISLQDRRRQNREEIIDDIVHIARSMIQADGAASLSFNAIARQLGIKPPSLYTYFDSKHAIYDELFRRGWTLFHQEAQQCMAQEGTFFEKLVHIFESYMRFAQQNPDYFQIMFQRPVPDFEPSQSSMNISYASLAAFTTYLQDTLEREGIDPGMPTAQARDLIIALMHGLAELHLANNPELPIGEGRYGSLASQAVTVLLNAWSIKK